MTSALRSSEFTPFYEDNDIIHDALGMLSQQKTTHQAQLGGAHVKQRPVLCVHHLVHHRHQQLQAEQDEVGHLLPTVQPGVARRLGASPPASPAPSPTPTTTVRGRFPLQETLRRLDGDHVVLDGLGELVDGRLELPLEVRGRGPAVVDVRQGEEQRPHVPAQLLVLVRRRAETAELLVLGVEEDAEEGKERGKVLHERLVILHGSKRSLKKNTQLTHN